jgi:ArsR family transcriptional regulator
MATIEKQKFAEESVFLAEVARALSHPARIEILSILAQRNSCICGDLVEVLPLSQATVSQHLKVLKEVGLIQGEIDGPRVCYCIEPATVKKAAGLLGAYLGRIVPPTCC